MKELLSTIKTLSSEPVTVTRGDMAFIMLSFALLWADKFLGGF